MLRLNAVTKNLAALVFGLALAVVLLVAIDLVFGLLNRHTDLASKFAKYHGPPLPRLLGRRFEIPTSFDARAMLHPDGQPKFSKSEAAESLWAEPGFCCDSHGGAPVPRVGTFREKAYGHGHKIAYEQQYTITEDNIRLTPFDDKASDHQPTKHLIFLGCSFTFGEGLRENETLPYYFQANQKEFRSYNLAFLGYGPNDLLARAQNENAEHLVKEPSGAVVYVFIEDHFRRMVGSLRWLALAGANHPDFQYDDSGKLVNKGQFLHTRPVWSFIARYIGNSEFVKFFSLDIPNGVSQNEITMMADMMAGLRDVYKSKFPNSPFIVVLYPTAADSADDLAPELDHREIHYLDYSRYYMGRYVDGRWMIPDNGHPNAAANRVLADQLGIDIGRFLGTKHD